MKKIIFLAIVLIYGCESRKGEQFNYLSKKELSQHQIGDIILQPTEFNGHRAEQGIILVKENWFSENQKLVQIPVFRVFTNNEQKKEPIFIFHGGPGLTNIVTGSISDWMLENHDVILLGYRGVDGEFVLHSKKANIFWRKEKNPMSEESLKKMMNILDNEIEKLVKKGIDINGYGIQNIIEDIETAREFTWLHKDKLIRRQLRYCNSRALFSQISTEYKPDDIKRSCFFLEYCL